MKCPLLIDVDGVLRFGEAAAPGLVSFFEFLASETIPFTILSNTTRHSGEDIAYFLRQNGVNGNVKAITTIDAAIEYIAARRLNVRPYVSDSTRHFFEPFVKSGKPDAVLIGDIGEQFSFSVMNEIFQWLHAGCKLIAMHKNRCWMPDGKKMQLDAGTFIHGLEYAARTEAVVIGKPSKNFFEAGLHLIGARPFDPFLMMGDDLEADIIPAEQIGGIGIFVRTATGKQLYDEDRSGSTRYEASGLDECKNIIKKHINIMEI